LFKNYFHYIYNVLIKENKYIEVPLIKVISPLVLGTFTAIYFQNRLLIFFSAFVLASYIIYFLVSFSTSNISLMIKLKSNMSIITFITIYLLAYIIAVFFNKENYKNHYSKFINKKQKTFLKIKIIESPVEKAKSYKILAKAVEVYKDKKFNKTSGKIIIYIEKDNSINNLQIGDYLQIYSKINEIEKPKNPNEFNYKNYLKYQNIYFQSYVKTKYWTKKKNIAKFNFSRFIGKFRKHLQTIINKYIIGTNEKAVVSALLLGNRNLLNKDILEAFSSSGATHILAVSGLHVGIFFTLLSFSFKNLKRNKKYWYLYPI